MATSAKKNTAKDTDKKKKAAAKKPAAAKKSLVKKKPAPSKIETSTRKAKASTETKVGPKATTAKKPTGGKSKANEGTSQSDKSFRKTRPISGGDAIAEKLWRLVGMVAFALIGHFSLIALLILSAMQYVVVFISDKPNEEIKSFVARLLTYFSEIFQYMSFKTSDMPFPFKPFPEDKD